MTERAATGALAAVLALLAPLPALAQQATDPDLEALIPDSALTDPESWARSPQAPAGTDPALPPVAGSDPLPGALEPSSPLAELPGFSLPWPEDAFEPVQLAPLDPDGDLQLAGDPLPDEPSVPLADGDETRLSGALTLVFPADPTTVPERAEIASRFKDLSALENLSGDAEENLAQVSVRARADRTLLTRLMRHYGYYDAQVSQTIGGIAAGEQTAEQAAQVRLAVLPGARYAFGAINLGTLDQTGTDYPLLRKSFGLEVGDPVNSDRIVEEQGNLDIALGENGYAFAKLGEPDLLIDHERQQGDLTLPVAPGGKYRIAGIVSSDPRFLPADHLQEIARFDPGDIYRRSEADDLRRAVLATGLVSTVSVTPRETVAPTAGQPGEVTLDLALTRAPLRTIAGAAGYDSADGLRVEASWEHRNLFPPEGMLRVRAVAGTKEQLAGVTFRRNNFKGRDQVLTLDLYADNVNREAFAARTIAFTGTFEKLSTLIFQKPWTWSAGVELLITDEREASVANVATSRRTYTIGSLPLRGTFDGSDDLLDPTRGFRAALRVAPEVSYSAGKTSTYARIQADASYYLPVGKRIVLAARGRLGSIPGTALNNIAPSRRFYAGGGGSVRGFGYQQIGPRDSAGEPSGGRSLSELSFEARIGTGLFDGALQVVPFIDAGAVDDTPTPRLRDLRLGAGLGIRYQTGFGPIRVDVGTPLDHQPGESRIGVYVALGQAF